MPYDDPDPGDPTMLVGVSLPADPDADLEMAYVFAEEFARLGFDAGRLERLFRNPFYAGAHRAWCSLGEERVQRVIAEAVAFWGPDARGSRRDARLALQARAVVPPPASDPDLPASPVQSPGGSA